MAISFNEIPAGIRVPWVYVEFDNSRAFQGPGILPYRILVVGQKTSDGSHPALTPIRVTSADQAGDFFGVGSMLHSMARAHFGANTTTETWFCALEDAGSAVAASGTITITGTQTAAGTINLFIAGREVRVRVNAGDTNNTVATNLAAAINAATGLPVTAVPDTNVITLNARNAGEAANDIDVRLNYFAGQSLPAGLNVAIVAMAGGTSNPDIQDVLDVLGDEWYNIITMPYTDSSNLLALEDELADRWGPLRQIDGIAFAAKRGTHAELGTFGDTQNTPRLSVIHNHGSPTPVWEVAAEYAAVVAFHGQIDPARPFQTLPLRNMKAPAMSDRFTLSERNLLLYDGIATFTVDASGVVRIERAITTYKKNQFGADDISYLDVNTPLTLSYLRYDFRNYFLRKYPRHKLANDGTRYGPGQAVITPSVGKAEAVAVFRNWEALGLVENIEQFKEDLIVERNIQDPNRLDFMLPTDLVNQLRVVGVQIGFLL